MKEKKEKNSKDWVQLLYRTAAIVFFALVLFLYMDIFISYEKKESGSGKRKVFGAVYMTMNNEFYSILNEEIKAAIEDRGDRLITLDPALDQKKQNEEIEQLIKREVDLIILNPVDWMEVEPALEKAKKAKIPVIVVDTPVYKSGLVASTIVSDNYDAGVLCALHMMSRKKKADIVLITHPNAKSARERIYGFLDTIQGNPNYRIVATEDGKGQIERTFPKMQELLKKGTQFDVVMALNDPAAMGAMAALENEQKLTKDILVYGVDGSPEGKKLIQEGIMTATVVQSPRKIGRKAAETAYQILQGEKVEKEINIPVQLIDKDNISDYQINIWQ